MEGKVIVMDTPVKLPFPKAIKCDQTLILVLWLPVTVPKCLLSPVVPHAARPCFPLEDNVLYSCYLLTCVTLQNSRSAGLELGARRSS